MKELNTLIKCQKCGGELVSYPKINDCDGPNWVCCKCHRAFDFSGDILNFPYCSYNGDIERDIYNQALKIKKGSFFAGNNYTEIINYILANVKINGKSVFDYDGSPRSLFASENYDLFISVFAAHLKDSWGIDVTEKK